MAIHALVAAVLIQIAMEPVRVSSAGSPQGGISAYVAGPAPAAAAPAKPRPAKTALKTEPAKSATREEASASGSVGLADGAQMPTGPVRLGSSGSITLVKRVQPVYPPMMQSARIAGQVVLDAIIHADGTIGEITVLRATNDTFARSAMDAVKQWRYEAIGFEAILTVTVNFTLT